MIGTAKIDTCVSRESVRVILTGGGSAGHVIPNISLIPKLQDAGCALFYVASREGVENELLKLFKGPVYQIRTGKFRRSFSARNVSDLFCAAAGVVDAFNLLRQIRPHVVFSKGGYVSLPVVIAAWLRRIPIVIHESDVSPGLANRISANFAHTICVTHDETKRKISKTKNVVVTGLPLRPEIFYGDKNEGLERCGFDASKPVLMVIGGGLGSKRLNAAIEKCLPKLLKQFQIVHLTGKGKTVAQYGQGYRQFEFVEGIEHFYACADIIVSRAGATTVAEIIALKKRNILIPLTTTASRGDQLENAALREKQGLSRVIREEDLKPEHLANVIEEMFANTSDQSHTRTLPSESASSQITRIILEAARSRNA